MKINMMEKIKKNLLFIVISILILILYWYSSNLFREVKSFIDPCENDIKKEFLLSEDLQVQVYSRDCGATTSENNQVKIINKNNEKIIFIIDSNNPDIDIRINNKDKIIKIKYINNGKIFKKENKYKEYKIIYEIKKIKDIIEFKGKTNMNEKNGV